MSARLPILTTSQAKTFRRCPRAHRFAYELGVRPTAKSDPLRFGSLMHGAIERLLQSAEILAALDWLRAEPETDPFDLVKAEELLFGYHVRWEAEQWELVATEREFRFPLRNPRTGAASRTWEIGGKIDAIVRRDGDLWIVEHKTSSEDISPGSPYWQKLRLDAQVSTYLEGARSLGFDPVGCIYNVIGKPALRPLKATPLEDRKYTKEGRLYAKQRETDEGPEEYRARVRESITENPDRYYQRGDVVRLESERDDAAWDLWQQARLIHESIVEERAPRNPEACFMWNRPCDYFAVCTGQASLENESLFRKVENVHEELSINDTNDAR